MVRSVVAGIIILLAIFTATSAGLKDQLNLLDGVESYNLILKLRPEIKADVDNGKVCSFATRTSSELMDLLDGYRFDQVFKYSESERSAIRSGGDVASNGEGFNYAAFSGLVSLKGASSMEKSALLSLAKKLEQFSDVEYCDIIPLEAPEYPSSIAGQAHERILRADDYTSEQTYLYGDQGGDLIGLDAEYAWSIGITGQGVTLADVEGDWFVNHEDLIGQNAQIAQKCGRPTHTQHGTRTIGVIYATNNSFGVTGMAYGLDALYGFSIDYQTEEEKSSTSWVEDYVYTIAKAADSLEAGDVLLLELQAYGEKNNTGMGTVSNLYVPVDFQKTVWDVVKEITDMGIIVVMSAGNGNSVYSGGVGADLDSYTYDDYRNRGDNGAIIVGAALATGRDKLSFSTYGSPVDLCGYGLNVRTLENYGYRFVNGVYSENGLSSAYTGYYSGTSSASPMVASAAALVQSYAKDSIGMVLSPKDMRSLLIETGTAEGDNWTTSVPLPNIRAAIEKLAEEYKGATFYTLEYIAGENGTISGITTQNVREGSAGTTVTAVPNSGFAFKGWSDGVTDASRTDKNINSDMSVTALFDVGTPIASTAIKSPLVTVKIGKHILKIDAGVQLDAIRITDMRGRVVISEKVSPKTAHINYSHLSQGIYLLQFSTKNGTIKRKILQ